MITDKKTEIICLVCILLAAILAVFLYFGKNLNTLSTDNTATAEAVSDESVYDESVYDESVSEKTGFEISAFGTASVGTVSAGTASAGTVSDVTYGISSDYADLIFDDSYVHTVNVKIKQSEWDYLIEHAEEEGYVLCDVEIDGETVSNVGIRPKGNSSLSSIAAMDSEHFSFKIEFDQYKTGNTYHGLDKLSLNNLGQDKSCMKDYFAYHMMNEMGVAAPLCSYTLLEVNGEPLGLYLAVETIEDSFCYRNYGENYGELYKPDVFDINAISPTSFINVDYQEMFGSISYSKPGERVDLLGTLINVAFANVQPEVRISAMNYVGDDVNDYDVIFDKSVFDITNADKKRYVNAVKTLNTSDTPTDALDIDTVLKYFVVHNFVNNYDSYNGVFVHNFYVHEKDGKLSLVPWDYNLAFGAFSMESATESFFSGTSYESEINIGEALTDEENYVNYPIDTPMYVVSNEDRPMFGSWINDDYYKNLYHEYFSEFLSEYFDSGKYENEYNRIYEMIEPYIEQGLTFYTSDEFAAAAANVNLYNNLRCESIEKQLSGDIPTTLEGQEAQYETLLDTEDLDLGTTISFEGVAFGITSEDTVEILDAVSGDHEHNAAGATEAIAEIIADPSAAVPAVKRVLSSCDTLRNYLISKAEPGLIYLLCIVSLIIAINVAKKFGRKL